MEKILPALFIFLMVNVGLLAQADLSIDPQTAEETFVLDFEEPSEYEAIIHGFMINNGDAPIDVRWVRVEGEMPEEWETQICDNTQCWVTVVGSNVDPDLNLNVPITLAPGESGTLDVHVSHNMVAGDGTLSVELYDNNNPDSVLVTGTYTFHIEDQSVSISEVEKTNLKVFPNPTTDYFELTNGAIIDEVIVHNVIGRVVKTFDAFPNRKYDITDLPNGMYLISLINYEEGILKTVRLSKRSFNP